MLLASLALTVPLLFPPQQEGPQISCGNNDPRKVVLLPEDDIIRCEGGAVVTYQDMRVESDWMEYNRVTHQLTAGDKVHFQRGQEDLKGAKLSLNVETKNGTLTEASGQMEGWYLVAGESERLVNGQWHLTKPRATACSGDCPTWHFTWREVTVTPGKDVSGKGMALRFRNVPVFYFPKVTVPTTSKERSSGFLMPSIAGSTTKGRSVRQGFYWVLGRSYDATLTGEYFTKRGATGTIDFRGVPAANTSINVDTLFAIDTQDQGGYRTHIRTVSDFWEQLARRRERGHHERSGVPADLREQALMSSRPRSSSP